MTYKSTSTTSPNTGGVSYKFTTTSQREVPYKSTTIICSAKLYMVSQPSCIWPAKGYHYIYWEATYKSTLISCPTAYKSSPQREVPYKSTSVSCLAKLYMVSQPSCI